MQHGVVAREGVFDAGGWPRMTQMDVQGGRRDAGCKEAVQRVEGAPGGGADDELGKLAWVRPQRRCDGLDPLNRHEAGDEGGLGATREAVAQERGDLVLRLVEKDLDGDAHGKPGI